MENLRVQELRIGNLVILCGNVYEIAEIRADGKFRTLSIKKRRVSGVINKENIKQIPLTEEWLLKVGFKDNFKQYELENLGLKVIKDLHSNSWICFQGFGNQFDEICIIEFVHQLQNLYFALNKKELTLKN